jgi:hypothetical protein
MGASVRRSDAHFCPGRESNPMLVLSQGTADVQSQGAMETVAWYTTSAGILESSQGTAVVVRRGLRAPFARQSRAVSGRLVRRTRARVIGLRSHA